MRISSIGYIATSALLSSVVLFTIPSTARAQSYCPPKQYSNDMTPDYEACERSCKARRNYWRAGDKTCVDKGFNGVMIQTASNAGDCPTCELRVEHKPGSNSFTLIANNGWQADMVYNSPGQRGAQGQGYWPADWPAPYNGTQFYIFLSRTDDHWGDAGFGDHDVDMTIQTQGTGDIQAKFHWVRGSNKNFTEEGFEAWE